MFFRNAKIVPPTFEERLGNLKLLGYSVSLESSMAKVTRKGFGAIVEDLGGGNVRLGKSGLMAGEEIATLTSGGFQMFFRTPSGKEIPALAPQLKALHAFDEDVREELGLISLYNVSLGTTSEAHMYDRVVDRDDTPRAHPWEK